MVGLGQAPRGQARLRRRIKGFARPAPLTFAAPLTSVDTSCKIASTGKLGHLGGFRGIAATEALGLYAVAELPDESAQSLAACAAWEHGYRAGSLLEVVLRSQLRNFSNQGTLH